MYVTSVFVSKPHLHPLVVCHQILVGIGVIFSLVFGLKYPDVPSPKLLDMEMDLASPESYSISLNSSLNKSSVSMMEIVETDTHLDLEERTVVF